MSEATQETPRPLILRPDRAAEMLGISRQLLWKLAKRGLIAQPVKVSENATGWLLSDLQTYVAKLAAERDSGKAKLKQIPQPTDENGNPLPRKRGRPRTRGVAA